MLFPLGFRLYPTLILQKREREEKIEKEEESEQPLSRPFAISLFLLIFTFSLLLFLLLSLSPFPPITRMCNGVRSNEGEQKKVKLIDKTILHPFALLEESNYLKN